MHTSSNAEAEMSDGVAQSTIAVHRDDWTDLSPDLAALVAPSVTVSSAPFEKPVGNWRKGQLARSRGNMPVGKHVRAAR